VASLHPHSPSRAKSGGIWAGHLPITRNQLLHILAKAAAGSGDVSLAERALVTVCEFWAAVQTRQLVAQIGHLHTDHLRCVSIVLAALGDSRGALAIDDAVAKLTQRPARAQRRKCVADLQTRLLENGDYLDVLIAHFAIRLH